MKITEISNQLAAAYTERAEMQIAIDELKDQLYRREVELTPVEGWNGKNEEQRKLDRVRVISADPAYSVLQNDIKKAEAGMVELTGTIQALESDRRGLEWSIRENLVAVLVYNLRGQQTPATEAESSPDDQPFDDVSDGLVDDEIFYTAGQELADHETPQELAEAVVDRTDHNERDEDIPF